MIKKLSNKLDFLEDEEEELLKKISKLKSDLKELKDELSNNRKKTKEVKEIIEVELKKHLEDKSIDVVERFKMVDYLKETIEKSNLTNVLSEYEELLSNIGFKITDSYDDENKEDSSTDIFRNWYLSMSVEKDEKKYSILIEGSALAEYSYGKWVDNSCYTIDNVTVSLMN